MRSLLLVGFASFFLPITSTFAADAAPAAPAKPPAVESAPTVPPPPPATPDDLSQYKTGPDLWKHVGELNAGFRKNLSGATSRESAMKIAQTQVPNLNAALKQFVATYPKDEHIWDAKLLQGQLGLLATNLHLPDAVPPETAMKSFQEIADAKDAPKAARGEATTFVIFHAIADSVTNDTPATWDAIESKVDAFEKEFGDYSGIGGKPNIVILRQQEIQALTASTDTARLTKLLTKLSTDSHPEIAAFAKQQLSAAQRTADLSTKPLPLKFTTVDGKPFDIANLRGKVVLVDFWATWCPPCRAEVPNTVALYKKYHDQGLEVIGISLDQDKDAMLKYTKENDMAWPQYFDGLGWDNAISKNFGIDSIPTMWLVDQKGMMKVVERGEVEDAVAKLLKK